MFLIFKKHAFLVKFVVLIKKESLVLNNLPNFFGLSRSDLSLFFTLMKSSTNPINPIQRVVKMSRIM